MRWLETIHIQVGTRRPEAVSEHLGDLVAKLTGANQDSSLLGMSVYRHGALSEDHLVVLFWEVEHMPQTGSTLGLRIKEMMSAYGLIDHTLWCLTKGDNHD
jgi:hypothetical protein